MKALKSKYQMYNVQQAPNHIFKVRPASDYKYFALAYRCLSIASYRRILVYLSSSPNNRAQYKDIIQHVVMQKETVRSRLKILERTKLIAKVRVGTAKNYYYTCINPLLWDIYGIEKTKILARQDPDLHDYKTKPVEYLITPKKVYLKHRGRMVETNENEIEQI